MKKNKKNKEGMKKSLCVKQIHLDLMSEEKEGEERREKYPEAARDAVKKQWLKETVQDQTNCKIDVEKKTFSLDFLVTS